MLKMYWYIHPLKLLFSGSFSRSFFHCIISKFFNEARLVKVPRNQETVRSNPSLASWLTLDHLLSLSPTNLTRWLLWGKQEKEAIVYVLCLDLLIKVGGVKSLENGASAPKLTNGCKQMWLTHWSFLKEGCIFFWACTVVTQSQKYMFETKICQHDAPKCFKKRCSFFEEVPACICIKSLK